MDKWRRDLIITTAKLTALEINWDGYGGIPVKWETLAQAIDVIEGLPARHWSVVPGGDGSLQIECHEQGFDIEIDILPVEPQIVARMI